MENKTAIEWLKNELNERCDIIGNESYIIYIFEKALEMEKEQIIQAFECAEDKCEYFIEEHRWNRYYHLSEDYYNETFKK